MIGTRCCMSKGVGVSEKGLPSFDKALLEAGVGNYNLVRLSSILPAHCEWVPAEELPNSLKEGSLLPLAYATISSDNAGETIVSAIGVGLPVDEDKVGVIMEYSAINESESEALATVEAMVREGFEVRGWELKQFRGIAVSDVVKKQGEKHTTFACIADWD